MLAFCIKNQSETFKQITKFFNLSQQRKYLCHKSHFKKLKGNKNQKGRDFSYLQKTWLIDQRVG